MTVPRIFAADPEAMADAIAAGLEAHARRGRERPLSAVDIANLAERAMWKCAQGQRGITTVSADETWSMAAVLALTGGVRRLRAALDTLPPDTAMVRWQGDPALGVVDGEWIVLRALSGLARLPLMAAETAFQVPTC